MDSRLAVGTQYEELPVLIFSGTRCRPHDWQEIADLDKSIEAFGYLSPVIARRNSAGTLLVLDGHARLEVVSKLVA